MVRYTDELDAVRQREQALRRLIALALAEEAGEAATDGLSEAQMQAADEAIAAWREGEDEQQDPRAFRPMTPLQELLAEYQAVLDRIADILDSRLS